MGDEAQLIKAATTIKAIEGHPGRVGGYLVVWGSPQQRDLQGEYFTPQTDLGLDWYEQRPALYHHGLDGDLKAAVIGAIDSLKMDDTGLWAEAQLDMRKRYVQAVMQLVDKGVLSWSSGSLPHLVDVTSDGEIKRWPIVEGSLTPSPAEPRHTDIHAIKSAYAELGLDLARLQLPDSDKGDAPSEEPPAKENAAKTAGAVDPDQSTTRTFKMDMQTIVQQVLAGLLAARPEWQLSPEEQTALIQQILASMSAPAEQPVEDGMMSVAMQQAAGKAMTALMTHFTAKAQKAAAHQTMLNDALKAAIATVPPTPVPQFTGDAQKAHNPGAQQQITEVRDMRFDHLAPEDLIFGVHVLKVTGKSVTEAMLRASAYKALKAAEKGHKVYGNLAVKSVMPAVKADEIVATNLTNYGAEWVGVAYETRLWESVREAPIYGELLRRGSFQVEVPQGMNSVYIPAEGTDPTWYTLVEQNDLDTDEHLPITAKASTPSTTRRQLTPGGIAARVSFTDFEDEDGLIPLLPFYRSRMEITAQEQIEYVIFNGDTATALNTNLNLIDGTPSVDSKGRGPAYLAQDGILKLALITTAALRRDGAAFDEIDFLETWKLLPAAQQIAQGGLMWVLDPYTYMAALNIAAFKTRDVFNPATVESGQLKNVYGIDAFRSGQIGKANTAGAISATPGNNTKGRLAVVRPDQWALGWKRKVRTESARDIDSQATVVVSTLRFGIQYRAATGGVAVSYNLTI